MARVLVTGASGFVGTAFVPRLAAAGHEPRLLLRRPLATAPEPGIEMAQGDLADPSTLRRAVQGMEAVVHLGAATSAGHMDPATTRRVNVEGARSLIEVCREADCRRLIVLSTQHVHLADPGLYGRTKRLADELFAESGLACTILRPSLVYGPGSRGVFPKLAALVARLPVVPILGSGNARLRPLYIEDLIAVILATLERPDLAGRTYDVGGPDLIRYEDFVGAICRALGRPFRRVHLPLGPSFLLAAVLERLLPNPPLTTENVRGARVEAPCDLTQLVRDLDPVLTPIEDGLRATFADWKP